MSLNQRLRDQLDACREGTGDLTLPALAELARELDSDRALAGELARSHRFDRSIRAALHDLPVPTGLADRLISAVQPADDSLRVTLPPPVDPSPSKPTASPRISRRLAMAIGSLALAALLAVSISPLWRRQRVIAADELAGEVNTWLTSLTSKNWRSVASAALPKGIAMDPAVVSTPRQWQDLPSARLAGRSAAVTAIDLAPPGQPRAVLFVVRAPTRVALPAAPTTTTRLALSGGFAATAWQRQSPGVIYVLVVEQDRGQRLEDFLRRPAQA